MAQTTQTLEQQRAAAAHQAVQAAKQNDAKRYNTLINGLPAMIMTNGLGQTLAFLAAKAKGEGNKPEALLARQLGEWILPQVDPDHAPAKTPDALLQWVLKTDSVAYRHASVEALAWLVWLRRFGRAEFGEPDADAEED